MELKKGPFHFEASHVLPNHPGKCSNLHGHSWVLNVYVAGPIDKETGMVQDFADISSVVKLVIDEMDHAHLGAWKTPKIEIIPTYEQKAVSWLQILDFIPTSENLLIEVGKQLVKRGLVFSKLTLEETCTSSATLTWKEFNDLNR